jgi:hypothetical protein
MSGWNQEQEFQAGIRAERERIIKLLEDESRQCEKAGLWANGTELRGQLQELHLGLNAAIALIKGENEHTHELDVFGAPCNCGTRHDYCNNCDWVEPCEIEGENK